MWIFWLFNLLFSIVNFPISTLPHLNNKLRPVSMGNHLSQFSWRREKWNLNSSCLVYPKTNIRMGLGFFSRLGTDHQIIIKWCSGTISGTIPYRKTLHCSDCVPYHLMAGSEALEASWIRDIKTVDGRGEMMGAFNLKPIAIVCVKVSKYQWEGESSNKATSLKLA